ncbi:MAG TPA: O-antigen ligase family protein [Ktedonobacterales bacterium]|nr:O-antigen ligase family protein [Ktedonobacterales bacterium]
MATHVIIAGMLSLVLAVIVVTLPNMAALWLVAGSSIVAMVILEPMSAFLLFPFAIAFGSLASISALHVNIGPTDLLVGTLSARWLMDHRHNLRRLRPGSCVTRWRAASQSERAQIAVFLALAAYLVVVCLSILVATDRVAALKEIVKWSEVMALVALSASYLRTAWRVRIVVWATIGAATVEALLGYAQWVMATGQAGPNGENLRVFGTFAQPNPYGGFLNFGLLLALALALFGRDFRERWLATGAGVLLLGAQALAGSRGALLGLLVALVVMVTIGARRERLAAIIAAVSIPLIAIGWLTNLIPERIQQAVLEQLRVSDALNGTLTSTNFSTVERLSHWVAGLRMFTAHPILGVGAGNYDAAYGDFALPNWPDALGHAHNYYINAAAETGILGLIAFLALTAATLYLGLYVARHTGLPGALPGAQRAIALGLLGAAVALAVHNLTDDLFVHAMELQFALTLGCLIALLRMSAARQSSW